MAISKNSDKTARIANPDRSAQIRLFTCLAVSIIIVASVGVIFYQQAVAAKSIIDAVITREATLDQMSAALDVMTNAESGQRGFLLTGNESYLGSYNTAITDIDVRLDHLLLITKNDSREQAYLANVAMSVRGKLAELKRTIELYRRDGIKAALHAVNSDEGLRYMNEIRDNFQAARSHEYTELGKSVPLLQLTIQKIVLTFTSLAILALVLFTVFAYFLREYVMSSDLLQHDLATSSQFRLEQAELPERTYDAVMVRDVADGTIRYWNRGAQDLYGFSAEEAIGRKSHELLQTQFPTALADIEKEAPAVGHWDGEVIQTTKDNRKLTVASRWRFKDDDHLSSILETDITERKRNEAEILRAKEEKIEQQERSNEELLELTFDAIMVRNLGDGTIKYWNRGAQHLYGYTKEEAIGRKSHELLKTEFPTALEEIEKEAPAIGHWEGELIQTTKDNRKLTVASRWRFKADIDGHLSSIMETDITERKRSEATILRAKEQKLVELERSNEELQHFAYVCSHDLQEPLRVISNFSQLLSNRYKGQLDEKADRFIGFIVDGSKRMQDLINDLLVLSRVQTKGQELSAVDCLDAVDMARSNLMVAIAENGAIIHCAGLPRVKGDPSQLMQLFQNLLSNALKFRSTEIPEIEISAVRKGAFWEFSVKDNGLGLDMKFAERIFIIFQRLHTSETYPGSGLGLAVCKKIVQRHGGLIWVESVPGKGTIFHFTMPVLLSEAVA